MPPSPILLFPISGCAPAGSLTEAQHESRLRLLRETVRAHWTEPGLQAALELMEMHGAGIQGRAILPGASTHEAGQAYGVGRLVMLLRGVMETLEKESGNGKAES